MARYDELLTTDTDAEVPHLCSFEGCPFAQTVRMTLFHKGVTFRRSEVPVFNEDASALARKPDWFLELSPRGRVPILRHRGRTLHESACVDQYIDEVFDGPRLVPRDPADRAMARVWLSQASITLPKLWYRNLTAQGADAIAETAARLDEFFDDLESTLDDNGEAGPWILGDTYCLADVFFAPFYERMQVMAPVYNKYRLPSADRPRVAAHVLASLQHPSFLATRVEPEWLRKLYRPFAEGDEWISAKQNRAVRDIVE